jgi:hypothetical protein
VFRSKLQGACREGFIFGVVSRDCRGWCSVKQNTETNSTSPLKTERVDGKADLKIKIKIKSKAIVIPMKSTTPNHVRGWEGGIAPFGFVLPQ